ncbi:MAG: RNA 2',3'-cyclic phosphodiesterase [Gaiellaceae bacterium]
MADDRIRLFCALQLPGDTVESLARWQAEHLPDAGRIVPPENLHVTLAFLGHRASGEVPAIADELREASAGAHRIELRATRYRETRNVGMVVLEDVGGAATALAEDVQERLERLGVYRRETRSWLPHLTVVRFKERAGLSPESPNMCSIHVVRSALYRSVLGRGPGGNSGARYDVLETAALGGR